MAKKMMPYCWVTVRPQSDLLAFHHRPVRTDGDDVVSMVQLDAVVDPPRVTSVKNKAI